MRLIIINIISNILVRLTPLIASFAILPFIIKYLGKDIFGVWAFLEVYLVLILSFDLGFGITNEREVARLIAQKKYDKLNNFIFSISSIQIVIGLLLAFVFLLLINYSLAIYAFLGSLKLQIKDLYMLFFFYVLTVYSMNNLRGILRGLQKHYVILIVNLIYVIFRVSLLIMFLPRLNTLSGYAILNFSSLLLELFILFFALVFILKINIMKLKLIKIPLEFLRLSKDVFLLQLLAIVLFASGKIILGLFVTASSIAYFEIGNRIFNVIRNFIDSIARVLLPVVSEINLMGDNTKLKTILTKGTSNLFYIWSFIAFPLLVVIEDFIKLWLGNDFLQAVPVIYLFTLSTGFIVLTRVSINIFIGSGNVKEYLKVRFFFVIFYFFLSFFLASKMGIIGPALAMLFYSVLSEIYLLVYSVKYFNLSFWNFLSSGILKASIVNIILFLIFKTLLCPYFLLISYWRIALIIILYLACYVLFLLSFIIKREEREFLLKKLFAD